MRRKLHRGYNIGNILRFDINQSIRSLISNKGTKLFQSSKDFYSDLFRETELAPDLI